MRQNNLFKPNYALCGVLIISSAPAMHYERIGIGIVVASNLVSLEL